MEELQGKICDMVKFNIMNDEIRYLRPDTDLSTVGMMELLKEEHDKRGTTVISVAHRKEFNRFADREIVLSVSKMR